LDEAHKLPEIASTFFSHSVSAQQIVSLCRDATRVADEEARDMPALKALSSAVEFAQSDLRMALGSAPRRVEWQRVRDEPGVADASERLEQTLMELAAGFEAIADRANVFGHMADRVRLMHTRWCAFVEGADGDRVCWVEVSARNVSCYDTPVSVAKEFAAHLRGSHAAWIMTSATLAVEGRFDHFLAQLGVEDADVALWASPFDYPQQSLLYLPRLKREPRMVDYERELVEAALPVLRASHGRAFFLFTSYRSLDLCAALLRAHADFPLLIQGEAPRSELLRRFLTTDRAVLLGTASFWEGVDVRGERLSCVIIDKLPFGVPDDPVTRARHSALEAQGENPFMALTLPDAITALKQGAGRLIRDVGDRGVLMIGDIRLRRKAYGRAFLNSLPNMPISDDIADVERFFAAETPSSVTALLN
jgi:ATP-dependent DNA helicase DinG